MLRFDDQFSSGQPIRRVQGPHEAILGCVLWADAEREACIRVV